MTNSGVIKEQFILASPAKGYKQISKNMANIAIIIIDS
jgi:hypothetical protein